MAAPAKILFIGLDSADPDLILQWCDAGVLPTLQALRRRSAWSVTTSPPGVYSGAVWTSFLTGVSPARHGLYYPRQIRRGTYHLRDVKVWDVKYAPFWDVVSRADRRVAIIDVPHAPLCENLNGLQLVDWATHDREYPGTCSWPPSLAAEVLARFGKDPVGNPELPGRARADYKVLRDRMVERIERKAELSRHYLEQGGWDLFMTVFADPHDIGHQCWHLHDPTYPKHDAALARSLGDPIKDIYVAIDAAIGGLLEQVGPETTVFVFSSHGMGPKYTANFLLDDILRRLNGALTTQRRSIMDPLTLAYRKILPVGVREHLRPLIGRIHSAVENVDDASLASDRSRCKCFTLPHNDISGAIRINLVGREPNGQIHPGAECDAFCEALTRDLLELVNLDTGKPLVQEVLRTADLYQGECLDDLPDLLVVWNRDAPISSVGSPKVGEITRTCLVSRLGDHKPDGLFFACGQGIKPGELPQPVPVEDFAPTIASLLGVVLPDVDGAPIAALVPENDEPSIAESI